ncbi:MAG: hypothetical protein FJX74_17640 [Armatimonadetes bacterium]|nr:hypothetical protein [Armatimonadota bacterium]
MRFLLACLLSCLALVGALWADPVAIEVRGGAAAPREGPCDVRMVAEDLTVDLLPEGATVKAVMDFHNEGADQEILIGFPQLRHMNRPDDLTLKDVAFMVDGEAVAVEHLPEEEGAPPLPGVYDVDVVSWFVAPLALAAGQSRRLEVSYRHRHGASAPGIGAGYRWFAYLLKTAGHWKGTLDRLNVTINYGDVVGAFHRITPSGYALDEANRKLTWQFAGFDGAVDEIQVQWWRSVPAVRVRDEAVPMRAYLANSDMPVLDVAPLARHFGWSWQETATPGTWELVVANRPLAVRGGERAALLDGEPCELLYPARSPLGTDPADLTHGCMLAIADIGRLVVIEGEYKWQEGYLSVR